jgi:hypothetical protein
VTYDEALEDHEPMSFAAARRELGKHSCRILNWMPDAECLRKIEVTNDIDDPEWIACTPAAILGWLGY